jgi:hypothetical protein
MTGFDVALDVLCFLAFILAAWRSRAHPEHRPLAILLGVWLPSVFVRRALRLLVFEPRRASLTASGLDPASVPLDGILRAARHLSDSCTLIWGWGLVALAVAALLPGRLRARWVALPYVASLAILILGYPELRYHLLAVALLVIHLVQVGALVVIVVTWLRRRAPSVQPSRVVGLVLVLAALHLALAIPMALMALPLPPHPGAPTPNPFAQWWLVQGQYVVIYGVVAVFCAVPRLGKKTGEQSGNGKANGSKNS